MANKFPAKDPADTLDEQFDWSDFLNGDTIASAAIEVIPSGQLAASGVTVADATADDATVFPDAAVVFQVSGGTLGTTYTLSCTIHTTSGNIVNRKATIAVKDL